MCNPDTGVFPFVWARDSRNASTPPHTFPEFTRYHQCKNFDTILEYTKSRKPLENVLLDIVPGKDSLILPDWPWVFWTIENCKTPEERLSYPYSQARLNVPSVAIFQSAIVSQLCSRCCGIPQDLTAHCEHRMPLRPFLSLAPEWVPLSTVRCQWCYTFSLIERTAIMHTSSNEFLIR